MNPRKLIAVALCATACATTVFAEDDFGIESASPVKIADPVNPQPGMVLKAYDYKWMGRDKLKEGFSALSTESAASTKVDKSENFSLDKLNGVVANVGVWEGFLKCKKAGSYTFLLTKDFYKAIGDWGSGFSFRVNGQVLIPATIGQGSCDVCLKVGWNKVDILCQFNNKKPLVMSYKPKGSLSDPRPLTPKDLFHDQKPEEDW